MFDEVQLFGVRQSAVGEPKFFIESFGIDDEGIPFPPGNRPTVIERVIGISAKLSLLSPSVGVDDPVVVIAAANEDEYTFTIEVLHELYTISSLELARPSRRFAKQEHWIVFQEIALTQFVEVTRLALQRRNLVDIGNVF